MRFYALLAVLLFGIVSAFTLCSCDSMDTIKTDSARNQYISPAF